MTPCCDGFSDEVLPSLYLEQSHTTNELTTAAALGDPHLLRRTIEVGALLIVPTQYQDPPLSADELAPKTGSPVIAYGLNFSELAVRYLEEVRKRGSGAACLPELPDLSAAMTICRHKRNIRMLIDHDTKTHRIADFSKFENYYYARTGEPISHSTLFRRLAEARFALLFSANGAIDLLASQAHCCEIARKLPRCHWVRFVRLAISETPGGRLGTTALERALAQYSSASNVPLAVADRFSRLRQFFGSAIVDALDPRTPEKLRHAKKGRPIEPWFKGKRLAEITPSTLLGFLQKKNYGRRIKRHFRELIHGLFRVAMVDAIYTPANIYAPNPASELPGYVEGARTCILVV